MKEKACIEIHCNGDKKRHLLRKGLGLQALGQSKLEFDCRKADCGICIVTILKGADHLSPRTPAEADFLRAMRADEDERLACQCRVFGDVELAIESL